MRQTSLVVAVTAWALVAWPARGENPVALPAGLPVGVELPVPVTVDASSSPTAVAVPGAGNVPVQREAAGTRAWFVAALPDPQADVTWQAGAGADGRRVTIREEQGRYRFFDGDRPVLDYQAAPLSREGRYERAGYLHPVWGLDGEVLTQDFPSDHYHQRGVFWAWHQNVVDGMPVGDAWATANFLAVVQKVEVVEEGPVFATLAARVHWTSPQLVDEQGAPKPFVEESLRVRVFRAGTQSQAIDLEIALRPLFDDVRIGGSEDEKEYSGFTVRVQPPSGMTIRTPAGVIPGEGLGLTGAWADVSGTYEGGTAASGVAVLNHPSLPEFPPRLFLRRYGMQNILYPGREPARLPREGLVLRHRLLVHRGDAEAARLAEQQRGYQAVEPFVSTR